jgi:membrane protein YdbS with pleckstrin-like domain
MLTQEEEKFFNYWKEQRLHKRKFLRKLSIGLPLAVIVALAFAVNVFSGWYTKAMMQLNSDPSVIIVILVALLAIVIFITIFSAHHRWDRNETQYQELLKKKEDPSVQQKIDV